MYKSCKEILATNAYARDGVYQLEHGLHHCIMGDIAGCGGGGWTLAMKIDGAKVCFLGFFLVLMHGCCGHELSIGHIHNTWPKNPYMNECILLLY